MMNWLRNKFRAALAAESPRRPVRMSTVDLKELLTAATGGDLRTVARKIKTFGLDTVLSLSQSADTGHTLVHYAAAKGELKLLELLLDHGADIDARDNRGSTPLHVAAAQGRLETAALLLQRGAALECRDAAGWTPLAAAAAAGQVKVAEFLIERGADINARGPLRIPILKVAMNHPALITLLLDRGADIEARDGGGTTPLMWAASEWTQASGRAAAVGLLLERGAQFSLLNDAGDSALSIARRNGPDEVVTLIEREEQTRWHREASAGLSQPLAVRRLRINKVAAP